MSKKIRRTERGQRIEVMVFPFEPQYKAEGRWEPSSGRYEVNDSSILTKLIHDTGRFTLQYASDLFIMWEGFKKTMNVWEADNDTTYVFGIRETGVDDAGPVVKALNDRKDYYYRAIWGLRVRKNGDEINLTMEKLSRVTDVKP